MKAVVILLNVYERDSNGVFIILLQKNSFIDEFNEFEVFESLLETELLRSPFQILEKIVISEIKDVMESCLTVLLKEGVRFTAIRKYRGKYDVYTKLRDSN